MGNSTSGVASIKKKGDLAGLMQASREVHRGGDDGEPGAKRPGLGKQISSKRFKKGDIGALQWKIFNDLDVQDDKMMLELAVFLHRLMKSTPIGGDASASGTLTPPVAALEKAATDYFEAGNTEGDERTTSVHRRAAGSTSGSGGGIDLENITLESRPPGPGGLVRIGSVQVTLNQGDAENLLDYSLSKDAPSIETVHEVIQLFAAGGKLSVKSLRRVLRDAYKLLKELPAVVRLPLRGPDETVTVVGDLHGQLTDLLHLLNHNGMPSATNKYVFNGDFVDRGPKGLEILVILFLLAVIFPDSVVLNRGNHEDFGLCCVYGFQKECLAKYNEVVFSMFCEMFRHLPICTVIVDRIFVVHGGLFQRDGITIADLEQVDRLEYVVPSRQHEEDDAVDDSALAPEDRRAKDLRTLMHCALWSDPDLEPSLPVPSVNPRGAGVLFGPDQTRAFLDANGLDMVVRSHECVEDGFDLPFEGEAEGSCATIFSASNYGGSMNSGATMRFSLVESETEDSFVAGGARHQSPPVYYTVHDYQLAAPRVNDNGVSAANRNGLSGLVLRKKRQLGEVFEQVDVEKTGWVTKAKWAGVMEAVTGLQIAWTQLLPLLTDPADLTDDKIQWQRFINKFHVQLSERAKDQSRSGALFDAMYANRDRLEAIFRFFDSDGNGSISREEFQRGCAVINEALPEGERLENADAMLDVMDLDGDASIDVNEFFEVFRLVDAADGTVDGQISLGK